MKETIRKFLPAILLGITTLALILCGFSLGLAEGGLTPTETGTLTSTAPVSPSASASATATETATALASQTATVSPTASVTPPANCPPPAGWVPVVVQQGQTLESIALQYNTTADALLSANCLGANTVPAPGSIIYVPPAPAPTAVPCGAPAGWVTYSVQPGDTLYHIATLYRVTVAQLMNANCLTSTVIYTGQRLYVPNVSTSTPSFVTAVPTPSDTPTLGPVADTPTPTGTTIPTATPTFTGTPTPTDTPIPADTATPTPTSTPSG